MDSSESNTKNYNYGQPIDFATISEDDLEMALENFSEGSLGLKECLKTCWSNSLPTKACCKGDHFEIKDNLYNKSKKHIISVGYVSFSPGIDAFSYLSSAIICNPYVRLYLRDNVQSISFYGKDKEQFFFKLTSDILSGKKNNKEELSKKINQEVSVNIRVESFIDLLESHGVDVNTISTVKPLYTSIVKLNYKLQGLDEESQEFLDCVDVINGAIDEMDNILLPIVKENNEFHR